MLKAALIPSAPPVAMWRLPARLAPRCRPRQSLQHLGHTGWIYPLPTMPITRNSELNLSLPLESWVGGRSKITRKMRWNKLAHGFIDSYSHVMYSVDAGLRSLWHVWDASFWFFSATQVNNTRQVMSKLNDDLKTGMLCRWKTPRRFFDPHRLKSK